MTTKHWGGVAAYGLPGIVVGLALAWWGGGHGPTARAQAAVPAVDTNGTIAFTTTSNGNGSSAQMLYLIDTKQKAFAIYRVDLAGSKGGGPVKLEAARKYEFDLQLNEFNNQQPEVSAVEGMVKAMAKSPR